MNSETLAQKIAELTAKHNLTESVKNALPNLTTSAFPFDYKKRGTKYSVHVNLLKTPLKDIKTAIEQVIAAYPATKNFSLEFASSTVNTENPYTLRFKNGVRGNSASLEYVSSEYCIHIDIPVSYYSDDVKGVFMRGVTDCEYHYYTGVSMIKIKEIQLTCYKLDLFDNKKYFGGDVVTYLADARDNEDVKEYESVLLTGHTPEFSEWYQTQLENL